MSGSEAIVAAVKARDTARVQALLAEDPRLAAAATENGSLLLTAVYFGAGEASAAIRRHRTDLDAFEAAAVGDVAALAAALDRDPAAVGRHNCDGLLPLALAGFFGQREAAALLLDCGADVNQMGRSTLPNVPRNTALHAALAARAWEVARLLLERGADVRLRDSEGSTPLHGAAAGGSADLAEQILARGADVNARDNAGKTPLTRAEEHGRAEAAAVLRRHGGTT